MAVNVAVTRVACNTSTGTQDITIGSFGTPKAALFICTTATADGTPAVDFAMSFGAATGAANEWTVSTNAEDGVSTTDNNKVVSSARCVVLTEPGTNTVDGDAEFSAWITDGVRINWTTAPSAAWLLTVVLFGGADLSAHANNAALGDTVDAAVDVTGPGFEPTLIFTAIEGHKGPGEFGQTMRPSYGVVHNNGAVSQICMAAYLQASGLSTAVVDGRVTETYGVMEILTSGALDWGGQFSDFDGSGFTITPRINGANNTSLCYLALSLGGSSGWVGTVDTPTATGNDVQTGAGFTPQFVYQIGTFMEAIDTAYNDSALAGTAGFSIFTSAAEYMPSGQVENNVGTTDTQSLADDTAVELPADDGTAGLTAAFVSMDSSGWTLNFSAVEANAKKFLALAIGEPPDPDTITRHRRYGVAGPF